MDDMSQKLMSLMNDPEIMSKIQGLSGLLSQADHRNSLAKASRTSSKAERINASYGYDGHNDENYAYIEYIQRR